MTVTARTVFEEHNIRLFQHRELIEDLQKLTVKEMPDGRSRLTAKRTAGGHADVAMALCTCLPYATSWLNEALHDQELFNSFAA
jgi:phage FluMu gp28-like protein